MRNQRRLVLIRPDVVALLAVLFVSGCGGNATDDLPRLAVSGEVKLDGSPLKSGLIQFMPADPGAATAGAGAVTDGKYSIAVSDGLVPGAYKVSVTSAPSSSSVQPATPVPGDPLPPPKEPIPSTYNSKTTLTATVAKDGPNSFNFELKSK